MREGGRGEGDEQIKLREKGTVFFSLIFIGNPLIRLVAVGHGVFCSAEILVSRRVPNRSSQKRSERILLQ